MKRIGLLTIHHSYNYGGALQTFATYKLLQRNYRGNIEIVDYESSTFIRRRQLFGPNNSLMNIARNIRSLLRCKKYYKRKKKFETFYSPLKKSLNHWINKINWTKEKYDLVMVGSDQTFGLYLTGKPNEMKPFFLEELDSIPKFAFASSMGEYLSKIDENDKKWMAVQWKKFKKITVREDAAASFIEQSVGVRPEIVLDPTLILDSTEWNSLIKGYKPIQGEYIAFYSVLSSKEVIDYVETLSKRFNLPVVALHSPTHFEISTRFHYIDDSGPLEFMAVIKNATYVVTTSFHGTVFAIHFHKQFQSLVLEEGNRLKTLANITGLQNRLISPNNLSMIEGMKDTIDYDRVDLKLGVERQRSINILNSMLENE